MGECLRMAELADSTSFAEFCSFLGRLRNAAQLVDKKREFEKFFRSLDPSVNFRGECMLPFLRILLPTFDKRRRFDIKEKKLCHRVAKILSLPAAQFQKFSFKPAVAVENLAREVSNRFSAKGKELSVNTVNSRLDVLAANMSEDREMEYFFTRCSEIELLWIFNLVIQNVESYIGASAIALLGMLGEEAKEHWSLCRELSVVVSEGEVEDCPDSLLGRNFRPMLLARLPSQTDWFQPIKDFAGSDFFVETKFDGEHVLLHRIKRHNYKYFTRNGNDFSEEYGASSSEGNISSRIDSFFLDSLEDCILDCELVLWDKATKKLCRHGRSASDGKVYSFRHISDSSVVQIAVILFDLLFYNGRSLLNVPLHERVKLLEKGILKEQAVDTISVAERRTANTREELEELFAAAMTADEEGVVVKRRDCLYSPGSRAFSNGFFKLKPNLATSASLDLAIVAILPGRGRNGETAFLLAARDETKNGLCLKVVGSTSSGMAEMERARILREATRDGPLSRLPPSSLIASPIEPPGGFLPLHGILVVEVACTGVRAGHLVDPVVRFIREKPVDEIDSTETFQELSEALLNCRLPAASEVAEKKSRVLKRHYTDKPVVDVKPRSSTASDQKLKGRVVAVLQGTSAEKRMEAIGILSHFGAATQANPVAGKTELVVAVTREHPKTRAVAATLSCPILHSSWLLRCREADQLLPWNDDEVISAGSQSFDLQF